MHRTLKRHSKKQKPYVKTHHHKYINTDPFILWNDHKRNQTQKKKKKKVSYVMDDHEKNHFVPLESVKKV